MNNPYWIVKLYNRNLANQWKSHNNFNVNAFVFSNAYFDFSNLQGFYNSNAIVGNNAYYNIGLDVTSFNRQFSGNYFENNFEDIAEISFTISRQWKDKYASVITNDWIELIRSISGANFSLDGAGIDVWLCSGRIPGYRYVGSNLFNEIAGSDTNSIDIGYDITDTVKKVFSGTINKLSRSTQNWSFDCESIVASTDALIGQTVKGGDNSTSTIRPLCYGKIRGDFGDIHGCFPIAQEESQIGLLKLTPCVESGITFSRLMYRDSNTEKLAQITSEIKSVGNNILLSQDVPGATLTKSRNNSEDWKPSVTELDNLFDIDNGDYDLSRKQVIHQGNDEQIGLHSLESKGVADKPTVTSTSITFNEAGSFSSRGWNNSKLASHTVGTNYNTTSSEAVGVRVKCLLKLPVAEMIEIRRYQNNQSDLINSTAQYYRGSTGDLWDLHEISAESINISGSPLLKVSQRGYGPATWNGSPTNAGDSVVFFDANLETTIFRFIIRPRKPNINEDESPIRIGLEFSAKVYVDNPGSGNTGGQAISLISVERAPTFTSQAGNKAFSATTSLTISGEEVWYDTDLGGSNAYQDFIDLFEKNGLAFSFYLSSRWSGAEPTIAYHHAIGELYRLRFQFEYFTDAKTKQFVWQGVGVGTDYADQNIEHLIESNTNIAVDTNLVLQTHTHSGYFNKSISIRDAAKEIAKDHSLLIRSAESGLEVIEYLRSTTFKTITEDDIYLLDDGLVLDLEVYESDLQDLYSEISVKFREKADDGEFANEILINENGWKDYKSDWISTNFDSTKWEFLTSTHLNNLKVLCSDAQKAISVASYQSRRFEDECRHIRTRTEAEKRLARLVLLLSVKRKSVVFSAPLESFINSNIGDQVEFDLSYRDSFIYQYKYGGYNRRFIITKMELTGSGSETGFRITCDELPYIPVLGLL